MKEEKTELRTDLPIPRRFTVSQRIEHFILGASFTVLGLTGLVQRFGLSPVSEQLISLMGGIQATRVIHRVAAIVFALLCVYHIIAVAHKIFVRRIQLTMIASPKDLRDLLHTLGYGLLLRKDHPKMPRYNFAEKIEYWALIWGSFMMLVTGFMLWNPLITTLVLPGQVIPAAKAVHSLEAFLAVLSIIVWHFYNVHIKMFNKSMFTGRMTRHQMEEEHGEELSNLMAGDKSRAELRGSMRRRQMVFVPVAIVFAVLGIYGIYWMATAETTAISTLPVPTSKPEIYKPAVTSGQAPPEFVSVVAPRFPHPLKGLEQCYDCHGKAGIKSAPANHAGRPVESCSICHRPGPPLKPAKTTGEIAKGQVGEKAGGPKAVPHPIDKDPYKNCNNCHAAGKMKPGPADHEKRPLASCLICHKPGPAPKPREATGEKPGDQAQKKTGGPMAVSHPTDKDPYKECMNCHGAGKIKPGPAGHEKMPLASCLACHKPGPAPKLQETTGEKPGDQGQKKAGGPMAVSHPTDKDPYKECMNCHGVGKVKPGPAGHEKMPLASCFACHKPGPAPKPQEPADEKPGETQEKAGGPKAVSHPMNEEPFKDCNSCHGTGKVKPYPEDHSGYPIDSCTACHGSSQ